MTAALQAGLWRALFSALLLLLALGAAPDAAFAQTSQFTNATTGAIPESTTCASTLTRTLSVATGVTIADVNIGVAITHGRRSDLRLSLTSPGGTTVNLMSNIAAARSNLNVLFDDSAAANITTHTASNDGTGAVPPYQRTFIPQAALSAFNGQNSAGTWTLTMCDSVVGTTGTFRQADLYITAQNADLSLTKTVSSGSITAGGSGSYTLTVQSAASSTNTATGITVRDILPAGATFVSAGAGYNSSTGIWTVGSLAPGASASLTINFTASASAGSTVNNTAEITASSLPDPDSTPNNGASGEDDYASASFATTGPSADLSLTQSVSSATIVNGANGSYTLTVTNAAGSALTANGITVGAPLPAGLVYVSASGTGSYNSSTGVWSVGTLAPGASATITISFTPSGTGGSTVISTAEITASSAFDADSTPNNAVTSEDDYATASFTISTTRSAGTAPTISCPVGSSLFDWQLNTWPVGSLNNSYTLAGVGSFNIAMSTTTPYVTGSPAINGNLTGGVTGEQSLFQNLNNNALADVATTVITMPGGLPGVQINVFDVDYGAGSYADKVTVTGSYLGNPVIPALTNGTANYWLGNTAYGDVSASDTTAAGTITVTFNSAIDTITVVYGNHNTAPSNPGNQWVGLGDIRFCNPYGSGPGGSGYFATTKTSSVISDGISVTNPKSIPGATVQYCILTTNSGTLAATNVVAADPLPSTETYVPGSMRSGTTCAGATTVEDDNNSGADEGDPVGMDVATAGGITTVTGRGTVSAASAFAMKFNVTVN